MEPTAPIFGSTPPPDATPANHYDFIVNYNKQPSRDWLAAASLRTRIAVVTGGALTLLLLIWIFVALLTSGSTATIAHLVTLTQEQNELTRISLKPVTLATQQLTQNFAVTVNLTLMSDQQAFVAYLTQLHAAPNSTTLGMTANANTDLQLKSAQTDGAYDQTYISIAQNELTIYARNLQTVYKSASGVTERQLLSTAYTHAEQLLTLSKQSQ